MTLLIDCFVGDDPMLVNVGKSIIQRNDSTPVTALYKDSNGSGVSGERVYFFSDNNYIGYGDSNEYGIAKLEYDSSGSEIDGYVGQGNGRIGIMAADSNPVTSGSVVSQPIPVIDALFFDEATSNAKASQYTNSDSTNLQVSYDNATILICSLTSGTRQYQTKINDTVDWRDSNTNYQIELDYEYNNGSGGAVTSVVFGNGRVGLSSLNDNATSGSGHITIISTGDSYIIKNNGVQVGSTTSMDNSNGFRFYVNKNGTLKFKNLVIYPI